MLVEHRITLYFTPIKLYKRAKHPIIAQNEYRRFEENRVKK